MHVQCRMCNSSRYVQDCHQNAAPSSSLVPRPETSLGMRLSKQVRYYYSIVISFTMEHPNFIVSLFCLCQLMLFVMIRCTALVSFPDDF